MRLPKFSPVARMSLGLTAMVLLFLMFMDIIGLIPSREQIVKDVRLRFSENLGVQVAFILRRNDMSELGRLLTEVRSRDSDLYSIALRKRDDSTLVQVGEHGLHWIPPREGLSNPDNIRVPLYAGKEPWGNLELAFAPTAPKTALDWLGNHMVAMVLIFGVAGFAAFYLYLRRALFYLDPTSAVPERVSRAFDTLREGVLILDPEGKIMLTNTAFKELHPDANGEFTGHDIKELEWLWASLGRDSGQHPWTQAIKSGKSFHNLLLELAQPDGSTHKAILSVTPIESPGGDMRGCLISIDDVSELHRVNEELLRAMVDLEASRKEVEQRNQELLTLATRDPLTGCLNRRAFFQLLDEIYAKAKADQSGFCCVMTDIDHFKSFNDRYGHAVGDDVIRNVVRSLQSELRDNDLICRYGGEEFCIILPDTSAAQAWEIAERLRQKVENSAGRSLRTAEEVRVTSSFGVAHLEPDINNPAELVGRADDALYESKRNGRNRVTQWRKELAAAKA